MTAFGRLSLATVAADPDTVHRRDMDADATILTATRTWLERAVIGLQLCPFAKAVHEQGRIRYRISRATDPRELRRDLEAELRHLAAAAPAEVATTLLIHPDLLQDFLDFNDFLDTAEAAVAKLGLDGVLQLAHFHPQYRFAGAAPDAIENYTNRAPYPILHLLREHDIAAAMRDQADADRIVERNLATMARLGHDGWRRLWQ